MERKEIDPNGWKPRDVIGAVASTRYEVVAEIVKTGILIRLGFSGARSKIALLSCAQEERNVALLLPHVTEEMSANYRASTGWDLCGIKVRFSGRTERECAMIEEFGL